MRFERIVRISCPRNVPKLGPKARSIIIGTLLRSNEGEKAYPTRHSLGAVLIEAGRPEQTEDVYRDDLKMWPENGWSLYGLMTTLRMQGRMDEARLVEKRFIKAFARADVTLTATRF